MKMIWKLSLFACVFAGLAGIAVGKPERDDAASAKVDEVVRSQMEEQKIPGVSLAVMRDGKIIKATGYGLASIELNVPVAPDMLFHSGSLAKAFTATAVMMLVEEGKIGLDDKISKYLPEAPPSWNEVTIRRLLTHTSGIRDFFGEDGDPQYDFHQDLTEDEMVRKFAAQTMRFPTGEKWGYCNAGYVILGVVIHRVTGKFWFDFEKERIFDPLGMTPTRLIGTEDIIPKRVNGYTLGNGKLKNEPWVAPSWYSTADGCLYTNVFDMAKWDAALYTEKLIKHSTLEQMWTPVKLNNGTTYPYGFAWRIREVNGHRIIEHDGVDTAYTTRIARYVNDRLSIIVLMNLGEDEEAAMPTRMTDNVAQIYIPGLLSGHSNGNARQNAAPVKDSAPSGPVNRSAGPSAETQPRTTPAAQPSPEMERLVKALAGTWSITLKVEPNEHMPKGGVGKGEEIWKPGPGGLSLIEEYHSTGDEGEITGLGVAWWDEDVHRYQVTWCDSSNPAGCVVMKHGAKWVGNEVVAMNEWEEDGKKFVFKEVFSDITPTSFRQSLYRGDSGGELKPLVVIYATKTTSRNQGHPPSQQGRFGDERLRQIEPRGHPCGSSGREQEVAGKRFATEGFATSHFEAGSERRECGLSSELAIKGGERGRNRTFNLLIKSQLLCQLSYAPEAG
jgi:CubicO group peptidase (beta-lactamase class C family)